MPGGEDAVSNENNQNAGDGEKCMQGRGLNAHGLVSPEKKEVKPLQEQDGEDAEQDDAGQAFSSGQQEISNGCVKR